MTVGASRRDAFTLLEVMAAVLVLGLIYTLLAQAAIRGVSAEGVSRRRVEASLIADRYLADLESQAALGQIPTSGGEEEDVDVYRVDVKVQSYDPTPMLEAMDAALKERGGLAWKHRSPAPKAPQKSDLNPNPSGGPADAAPVEDLLAAPRPGQDSRLRRIDVSVAWQEGDRVEQVLRTTFAFDRSGLDALFPKKNAAGTDANNAKANAAKNAKGKTGMGQGGSNRAQQPGSRMSGPGFNSNTGDDFGTPIRNRMRDIRNAINQGDSQ